MAEDPRRTAAAAAIVRSPDPNRLIWSTVAEARAAASAAHRGCQGVIAPALLRGVQEVQEALAGYGRTSDPVTDLARARELLERARVLHAQAVQALTAPQRRPHALSA
ncbi:MAG TPA: hypothetical protein VF855_13750 [Acidimicrobiales bacterium]